MSILYNEQSVTRVFCPLDETYYEDVGKVILQTKNSGSVIQQVVWCKSLSVDNDDSFNILTRTNNNGDPSVPSFEDLSSVANPLVYFSDKIEVGKYYSRTETQRYMFHKNSGYARFSLKNSNDSLLYSTSKLVSTVLGSTEDYFFGILYGNNWPKTMQVPKNNLAYSYNHINIKLDTPTLFTRDFSNTYNIPYANQNIWQGIGTQIGTGTANHFTAVPGTIRVTRIINGQTHTESIELKNYAFIFQTPSSSQPYTAGGSVSVNVWNGAGTTNMSIYTFRTQTGDQWYYWSWFWIGSWSAAVDTTVAITEVLKREY